VEISGITSKGDLGATYHMVNFLATLVGFSPLLLGKRNWQEFPRRMLGHEGSDLP